MNTKDISRLLAIMLDDVARQLRHDKPRWELAREYMSQVEGARRAIAWMSKRPKSAKGVLERADILINLMQEATGYSAELAYIKASVARTMSEINAKEAA